MAAMTIGGFASLRSRAQFPIVFRVRNEVAGEVFPGIPGEIGGDGVLARHKRKNAPREEPPSRARLKEEVKRF